jgi:hypothetical protein
MEYNVAGFHQETPMISRLFVPARKHESCIRFLVKMTAESGGAN